MRRWIRLSIGWRMGHVRRDDELVKGANDGANAGGGAVGAARWWWCFEEEETPTAVD